MAGRTAKAIGISALVLAIGIYFSSRPASIEALKDHPQVYIALLALLTVILMAYSVSRYIKGEAQEVFITGIVLSIVEAYAFFIQPHWTTLPSFPGDAELFIGFVFIFRAAIWLLENIENPLQKPLKSLTGAK
jgi:uncharacterized membrane protein YjjP (DUF1212 family)